MTRWRAWLSGITHILAPAWRRMLLGVFLAGLGYLAFLPPFEGRQEAEHARAVEVFASTGQIVRSDVAALDPDLLGYDGPWPALLAGDGRPGYATSQDDEIVEEVGILGEVGTGRYRAHPLALVLLTPARLVSESWSWPDRIRLYRVVLWSFAMLGFLSALMAGLRYRYLDQHSAVLMAAWPFVFPQFFAQMSSVGGAGAALGCLGIACAAAMALSRRNELTASLGLGLALGLGIWADSLVMSVWTGLAAYLVWRGWRLHRAGALDGEWLVLRVFAMGLALLIGSGWLIYSLTSAQGAPVSPVLSAGFFARLWSVIASFSGQGGASMVLPGPGLRLVPLALLTLVLIRWEMHWRDLQPLNQAPAFILPVFALFVLLSGLQGYATDFADLHMLAPFLGVMFARFCQRSWLALGLIVLSVLAGLAHGLVQASVFAGCALMDPETGRYGYEGASCLLDGQALDAVSAPGVALKALALGGLSALTALYTLWRQAAWQRND